MPDPATSFVVLVAALLGVGFGVYALRAGEYRRAGITRRKHPIRFWFRVSCQLGIGLVCLNAALRMSLDPPPKRVPRDVCADHGSAFDCFMAERFSALVSVVLAVGVPLGLALWRRYQTRTLERLMATASAGPELGPKA